MHKQWVLAALMGATAMGCGSGDIEGTVGQLGEGVFRYSCAEESDARCNETDAVSSFDVTPTLGVDPELPTAIAVGARFDLTYLGDTIDDGELLVIDVEPARSDIVSHTAWFVMEAPGTFAFLARNGPKRRVVDFVHLDAVEMSRLDVWHLEQKVSSLALDATQETELAVVPTSEGGLALAGAVDVTWTSSDPAVIAIASLAQGSEGRATALDEDEVRLIAVGEGTATLTITSGAVTEEVAVTVNPEVMP